MSAPALPRELHQSLDSLGFAVESVDADELKLITYLRPGDAATMIEHACRRAENAVARYRPIRSAYPEKTHRYANAARGWLVTIPWD